MTWLLRLIGLDHAGSVTRVTEWFFYTGAPIPTWALALLVAVGLAAACLNFLPQNTMPLRNRIVLSLIRAAGFALALLMLAQLELRLTVERRLLPRVALRTDASGSMDVRDADGQTRRARAQAIARDLAGRLEGRADVSRYAFAWRLEPADGDAALSGATRLTAAVEEAVRREDNLDAVLLVTDGNDTGGDRGALVAPLLASRGVRVYPIVLGSPNPAPRAEVRIASGAPYVRLGDETAISAVLSATGLDEQVVRAALYEKGAAQPIGVKENIRLGKTPVPVSFAVKPARAGEKTYRIALEGVHGGASEQRLAAEHRIDVIDAKVRVLYVDIPRDERKILGEWLSRDPVVELATLTLLPKGGWYGQGALKHKDVGEGLPGNEADLYQYDVIILGDIPRSYFRKGGDVSETKLRWLCEFVARRGGGLVTLGGRAVYGAGNYQDSALAQALPFDIACTGDPQIPREFPLSPTALGLVHPIMQIENTPEANREAWLDLPTLEGCNRVGPAKPGATLLAVRPMEGGAVPVIAIQDVGKGKVLALSVDTTWRWEMMRDAEAPDRFRRFWGNAVRYVSPDPRLQPGRPQIQRAQMNPAVGETLAFSTRLVDKLFQPVRGADLAIAVKSPSGRLLAIYPRDSRGKPGVYEYEVTLDEPGDWLVTASNRTDVSEQTIHAGESDEEMDDPRACPDRMKAFAAATGGRVFAADQARDLTQTLQASGRLVTQTHAVALWNLPLTLTLFIALVCLDCLIRKRRGMV